ncbi:MAG: response regulator [Actinomycetota bacterium]|nr:response regulator [Actinomycetota bacterium]
MPNLLIAEDDPDIRELISFRLSAAGHAVTAVEDGPSALDAAADALPDLVLLDVMMPGLSGIDVCRALRAQPETADLPVILLTARSQEADVQAGFRAGADDYMTKPFSPRELVSRINALLARRVR